MSRDKAKIAIAVGDPAGIGPEISIKAALDPAVRAACRPLLVSDRAVIERHAKICGSHGDLRVVGRIADVRWDDRSLYLLDCPQPQLASLELATCSAAGGQASLA